MRHLIVALALIAARPGSLAAQQDSTVIAAARIAAERWLVLVDQGAWAASWDSASAGFRQAVTAAAWTAALRQARGPYEPFGGRHLLGSQYQATLPNAPPGPYVILQYQTQVSQGRTVIETVVPGRDPDGRWRVGGYFIRPR
jgi:hypothetical protein